MTDTPAAKALTEALLTVIRQQRHYGTRVIISTQEPTISPKLIDLCSVTVIHRFSSPEWFTTLRRHISLANEQESNSNDTVELFRRITNLNTGEALVFAPSALVPKEGKKGWTRMAEGVLKIKVRKRVTFDRGKSVVCL
jgi:DNA helicase HerA-like ATPase